MEKLPAATLLLDHDFNHIYSNPSFLNFFGLNTSQIRNKDWSLCLDNNDRESVLQLLFDIKHSGMLSTNKSLKIFKNKDCSFSSTVTIIPMDNQISANTYMLTFSAPSVQDYSYDLIIKKEEVNELVFKPIVNQPVKTVVKEVSEQKTSGRQIEKNQAKTEQYITSLKESNELKDKVLAIISHDLRSPITSLKGLSADFFDEELTICEKSEVRESLLKQLDAVSDLTENLLRWATLSFLKQDAVENRVLNLFEIVKHNIELVSYHALSKNISIQNDIPEGVQAWANQDQIDIVIRNLISNAIKYTPENGSVSISGTDLKTHTQISITDTGIGITKEQLSKLFTYSHGSTYGTHGEKGTGLGLLLCKEYVEFNCGKILVSSEVNNGTTIVIELPDAKRKDKYNDYEKVQAPTRS